MGGLVGRPVEVDAALEQGVEGSTVDIVLATDADGAIAARSLTARRTRCS